MNRRDVSSLLVEEKASPGYFSAILQKYNIKVELITTHSAGLNRYTFLEDGDAHILIDAGAMLYKGFIPQILLAFGIEILSDTEVVGYGKVKGGWNVGEEYTVYFYARFDVPMFSCGTMRNMQIKPDLKKEYPLNIHDYSRNGCYFSYKVRTGEQLNICVGISFISAEKAKENAEKEVSKDDFETIHKKARTIWEIFTKSFSGRDDR